MKRSILLFGPCDLACDSVDRQAGQQFHLDAGCALAWARSRQPARGDSEFSDGGVEAQPAAEHRLLASRLGEGM